MERGFLPDRADSGQTHPASWVAGDPVPRRFIGGVKFSSKESLPVTAYRCTKCGFLELYARA